MSRQKRSLGRSGFTLIELMIAISIIVILSAIAVPNVKVYRARSLGVKCNGNLHAVQIAVNSYAMMFNVPTSDAIPLSSVTTFLHRNNMTICPMGQAYRLDGWWPLCPNRGSGTIYHWVPAASTNTGT